jgi:L-asparaginase II
MAEAVIEVRRGDIVESQHHVHIAVVDGHGRLRAHAGDPARVAFARSAIKPMQAVPLIEDGVAERFSFDESELALCCASHNGEARHITGVASMLRKIGAAEEALACGAHIPMGRHAAEELAQQRAEPTRLHNNCSGKHAGMLALARVHGWPLVGYHEAEHPVQERMQTELARWAELNATICLPPSMGVVSLRSHYRWTDWRAPSPVLRLPPVGARPVRRRSCKRWCAIRNTSAVRTDSVRSSCA